MQTTAAAFTKGDLPMPPALPVAVVACMDARLNPYGLLGLSEGELRKVVVTCSPVLGYSYEANVEPSLAKLQGRLGLSEAELRKVVVTCS